MARTRLQKCTACGAYGLSETCAECGAPAQAAVPCDFHRKIRVQISAEIKERRVGRMGRSIALPGG
ncbi:MAG: hypothetical protein Ct9H90mP16_09300 [Candidatus Poseidoniales archaeon]|nr:MAG: hypothetical protein Ct9H90mP16_09300 [Candidatus Poseidoniales archaeon]